MVREHFTIPCKNTPRPAKLFKRDQGSSDRPQNVQRAQLYKKRVNNRLQHKRMIANATTNAQQHAHRMRNQRNDTLPVIQNEINKS